MGFTGTPKQVRNWVYLRRESLAPTTPKIYQTLVKVQIGAAGKPLSGLPSSKQLAWIFVKSETALNNQDGKILERLLQNPRLRQAHQRIQTF